MNRLLFWGFPFILAFTVYGEPDSLGQKTDSYNAQMVPRSVQQTAVLNDRDTFFSIEWHDSITFRGASHQKSETPGTFSLSKFMQKLSPRTKTGRSSNVHLYIGYSLAWMNGPSYRTDLSYWDDYWMIWVNGNQYHEGSGLINSFTLGVIILQKHDIGISYGCSLSSEGVDYSKYRASYMFWLGKTDRLLRFGVGGEAGYGYYGDISKETILGPQLGVGLFFNHFTVEIKDVVTMVPDFVINEVGLGVSTVF
jgi:hypothetical protein